MVQPMEIIYSTLEGIVKCCQTLFFYLCIDIRTFYLKKMKKRIALLSCVCAALVCGSALIYAQSRMGNKSLIYENIEALSQEEDLVPETCFETVTAAEGRWVRYCPGCVIVEGKPTLFALESTCIPRN